MSTKIEIANQALLFLKQGILLSDFDSDTSKEAKAIRTVYETCRKKMLEDAVWPFTKKMVALGSLTRTDPSQGWEYFYTYPSDCLKALYIVPEYVWEDVRTDDEIPFRIFSGSAGKEIWTNQQNAVLQYCKNETNPGLFPAGFSLALSLLIASMIGPNITGNPAAAQALYRQYELQFMQALGNALNEERAGKGPDPSFVSVRRR